MELKTLSNKNLGVNVEDLMDLIYQCASCGKTNEVFFEEELGPLQQLVEDCAVCCRPMVITARWNEWAQNFDLEIYQEDMG